MSLGSAANRLPFRTESAGHWRQGCPESQELAGDAETLQGRRLNDTAERLLFGLVANRALAPSSKLAATRWISEDVVITGLPAATDDACYRAMDWLLEISDQLERKVFDNLADLLNLEVDLLFFDYPADLRTGFALAA